MDILLQVWDREKEKLDYHSQIKSIISKGSVDKKISQWVLTWVLDIFEWGAPSTEVALAVNVFFCNLSYYSN